MNSLSVESSSARRSRAPASRFWLTAPSGSRQTTSERDFIFTTPATYNQTGFIISVPVVAPLLYDVILTNKGTLPLDDLYVALLAQEI